MSPTLNKTFCSMSALRTVKSTKVGPEYMLMPCRSGFLKEEIIYMYRITDKN